MGGSTTASHRRTFSPPSTKWVNEQTSTIFYNGSTGSVPVPSIYQLASKPKGRGQHAGCGGFGASVRKIATVSATYINSRGLHQYLSKDVNAYTSEANGQAGIRPNGVNENIYQFQSGGLYKQNQLMVNYSVQAKSVSIFGFYSLTYANADTSGASYFLLLISSYGGLGPGKLRYT